MNELNANNKVPIPVKRNYLDHLINAGYTPTICLPDMKIPFYKEWQKTFFQEQREEFRELLESQNYDLNFGILTGLANFNNVVCIDFDTKQFIPEEQQKLINHINNLLQTEYIQQLIKSKKIYIEKSVNNGYHFVASVNDTNERKGIKLLDYSGELKPNNLINEVHSGLGEFLETRGVKQHFITFPSNGYSRLHNTIWELQKLETEEYNELEKFVIDFFLNIDSIKFKKANEKNEVVTSKKIKIKKSGRSVTTEFSTVIEQLKKYQSTFSKSNNDISIISKLLQDNGYTLISENEQYYYFIHPLSSKAEPNISLDKINHCITNFSTSNDQFPTTKSVGTLTGFYILLGSKHSVTEIIQILREQYDIKLVRTAEEILQDAKNNINNKQNNN